MSRKEKQGGLTFLPVLMILIALVVIFLLINSSLFNVSYVHVYGTERFAQEILDNAGINQSVNILHVDEATAREVIESNPYLSLTDIRRVFPTGVEIYVHERQPLAQIGTVNGYYVTDEAGIALSLNPAPDPLLITVEGLGILQPVFGQCVQGNDEAIESLAGVLAALREYGLEEKVTSVDVTDPAAVRLIYDGTVPVIIAGGSTARAKIARLEATVAASRALIRDGQAVHMETEGAYYIG